jgi:hypothetical protein
MIRFDAALGAMLVAALSLAVAAAAPEPTLTLESRGQTRTFTRTQLWNHPLARMLEIKDDPAYPGRTMVYRAVPAWAVFEGLTLPESDLSDIIAYLKHMAGRKAGSD